MSTNMMEGVKAIQGFWDTGKWNFNWTPLLDGFKATTEKLPELIKPPLISAQKQIDAITQKISDADAKRLGLLNKPVTQPNKAAAAGDVPGKAKQSTLSIDLAELQKGIQEKIFGKDDAANRTADAAQQAVGLLQRNNELQERILKKPGGPGFAV